jgi:D-alanine transaminase
MLVYLNGSLVPAEQATVSTFDRGFIFGDGIYEGLRAFGGRIRALDHHVARLAGGLHEIRLAWDATQLRQIVPALLDANQLDDAFIYLQVTRGTPGPGQARRARVPDGPLAPTVFAFCVPAPTLEQSLEPAGKSAMTAEDFRWQRGHIKSISLGASVMAALMADEHREDDVIFVRDGLVGEGTSTNVVVSLDGHLVTPALDSVSILSGVTRALTLSGRSGIEARPVTVAELRRADEVMLVGTLTMVASVVRLDGAPVGDGCVGPAACDLAQALAAQIRANLR